MADYSYLLYSIYSAIVVWLVVVINHFLISGSVKFKKFNFSVKNYYIWMSPFLIGLIIYCFKINSVQPLIQFMIFAVMGVTGETLISIWWRLFFKQPFWTYNITTFYHRYTSWLNFIPWGVGGMIYLHILNIFFPSNEYPEIGMGIILTLTALSILQIIFFRPDSKFDKVTVKSFFIFYSFIILSIVFLAWQYGTIIYILALWFGLIGAITEYLFGKATEFFITKKLWAYTYMSVDRGHFTLLSIPLFSLAGFYFSLIAILITR